MNSFLSFTVWLWFGLAIILGILELFISTSFFLVCLGSVALVVGLIVWIFPQLAWEYQILLFAVGAMFSISIWRSYFRANPFKSDNPTLNRRAEQYIGRTYVLLEPIVNGRGKIIVNDTTWQVEGEDLPAGAIVEIIGAESTILKVKPKR